MFLTMDYDILTAYRHFAWFSCLHFFFVNVGFVFLTDALAWLSWALL